MSINAIVARIREAEYRCGRVVGSTKLMAVSKKQPTEKVESLLAAGHRTFGENRVQDAATRWPPLLDCYKSVDLHLIGPLQTNKARQAMKLFGTIQTVDRLKLVHTLARLAQDLGRCPQIYIQVNIGREPQKSGVPIDEYDGLLTECRRAGLPLKGLMCIPPEHSDPSPYFAQLADMADHSGLAEVSMGMSGDYEVAVEQGATIVRIGSALFGERNPM